MQKDVVYSIILIIILVLGAILYIKNTSSTTIYKRPIEQKILYTPNTSEDLMATSTEME